LGYHFSIRANPYNRFRLFDFEGTLCDICNPYSVFSYGDTGKISVLFMISVTNPHFSEIDASGPKSLPENQNKGKGKDTRCWVGGKPGLGNNFQLRL